MNKSDFLSELRRGLGCLPEEDIEKSVDFYAEMIDDKMEEGLTEEEAVAEAGSVDEISARIIAEIPLTRLVKARVKPKRALKAWEIVLIAAGSPVWLSLLVAVAVTVVSVYASLWAVIVSLYSVVLSFGAGGLAGIVGAAACPFLSNGNAAAAVMSLGAGLICAGLAVLSYLGCFEITKGMIVLTEKALCALRSAVIGKEERK